MHAGCPSAANLLLQVLEWWPTMLRHVDTKLVFSQEMQAEAAVLQGVVGLLFNGGKKPSVELFWNMLTRPFQQLLEQLPKRTDLNIGIDQLRKSVHKLGYPLPREGN